MIISDRNAWGKGYAGNALHAVLKWLFYELNMHRVTLEIYATNKRALKFLRKWVLNKRTEPVKRILQRANTMILSVSVF